MQRGSSEPESANRWVSEFLLRSWVPELSDVPPESPQEIVAAHFCPNKSFVRTKPCPPLVVQEDAFLKWLGVEQQLACPELILGRLKSHSHFVHRFLDELPVHLEVDQLTVS